MIENRVNVKKLRAEFARYQWRAERHGFGWRYHGESEGEQPVTLQAHAVLCGPLEDDCVVRWYVQPTGESFSFWAMRELGRVAPSA